ncbi:prohibitin-1, mitochondrial-like [Carya illinoinensis]|uniref:prohibitin-1, mitochondrial-like n=1 Tax=Carya illinoinensis TaxID=32201 RepID=UPI001C724620|nr:prohibitin-1, mitochondrial-like [Carya illinoinensis]
MGANPYVWRGIWETKHSLLKGCRWRVGKGLSINIWIDCWLPNHKLLANLIDIPAAIDLQMVASLIKKDHSSWGIEKVKIGLRFLTRPVPDQLPTIYQSLGENYNGWVLLSIKNETMSAVVAQYNANQLITQREVISKAYSSLKVQFQIDLMILANEQNQSKSSLPFMT